MSPLMKRFFRSLCLCGRFDIKHWKLSADFFGDIFEVCFMYIFFLINCGVSRPDF